MTRQPSDRSLSQSPCAKAGPRATASSRGESRRRGRCVAARYYWPAASANADPVDVPATQSWSDRSTE